MGKKKPFIDKKNSSTYHIVRRSQRDVGGYYDESTGEAKDVPSEFLLMPSPDTLKKQQQQQQHHQGKDGAETGDSSRAYVDKSSGLMSKMKNKLGEAGLLDDEYDYERHMKPITGSGVYFSGSHGGVDTRAALGDARALAIPLNDEIRELDRDLDAIALSQDCMDDDIAQALFGDFEDGQFEEILDDFCITAAQEITQEELQAQGNDDGNANGGGDFDYDAHIQSLINKAKTLENGGSLHSGRQIQNDFFTGKKALHRQMEDHDDEDDYDDESLNAIDEESTFFREGSTLEHTTGVVAKLAPDEEQALVEKFEMALAQYDSDEVGDLDNECMEIGGDKPLEGDKQIDAVFDDFLTVKRDEIFIEGIRSDPNYKRNGGSGFSALVGKRMVVSKGLKNNHTETGNDEEKNQPVEEETENVKDILAQADQILANPEMDLPPEEVLIDGKSYFTERTVNPWDCESILSTYSNLDNNPATISRTGNRRRKKKSSRSKTDAKNNDSAAIPEDQPAQILLSQKTGLPIGVLPTKVPYYTDDDTLASVNKGEARRKGETKEEKRLRKQAVKQEKKIAQFQKKIMQEAFAEEFGRRNTSVMTNDVGGKSVFRYS